jgi:hypothetical protein
MTYNFTKDQLELVSGLIESRGVAYAFRIIHWLNHDITVPADDLVDFYQQFIAQYNWAYGCSQ